MSSLDASPSSRHAIAIVEALPGYAAIEPREAASMCLSALQAGERDLLRRIAARLDAFLAEPTDFDEPIMRAAAKRLTELEIADQLELVHLVSATTAAMPTARGRRLFDAFVEEL